MGRHGPRPAPGRVRGDWPRGRRGPSRRDWPAYVDAMLGANPDADPGAVATPMPTPGSAARPRQRRDASGPQSSSATNWPSKQGVLSGWWLRRMVAVRQPVHEKLTLLWHNHFATSAQKVRVAAYMAAQNQKLRTLSLGDFRTLAYSMLTDAAMLRWLDGQTNTAKAAQRKPRSRIHGAVRIGPRQRLHRRRRARRGPSTDWMGHRRRRPDLAGPQAP